MSFLLKQIFAFLKLLNSDTGTNQIASGIAAGFILGMAPTFSLQTILIIILLFFFRIQIGAATLSAFFFKFVAFIFDPVFNEMGKKILEMDSLKELFATMYNMPIVPFTRFNNSIVMGAGVTSIVLAPFIYVIGKVLVIKYRVAVVQKFKQTKAWKAFTLTTIYQWYLKYDQIFG
ncbi:MAG: TIGR03546 family protein [Proteobacteria bacterium SG_bin7]|nr:MAG: TIGR03546 family protein [Proteobacteria bacterium SG_bin7]